MNMKPLIICGFCTVLGAASVALPAEEPMQEPIFGYQLMTEQERQMLRNTIRNLQSEQERRAYLMEHHRRMLERADELGFVLHDRPLDRIRLAGMMNRYRANSCPCNRQGRGQGSGTGGGWQGE